MNTKKLLGLMAITVITAGITLYTVYKFDSRETVIQQPLFPELAARINEAAYISVRSYEDQIILEKDGHNWNVSNRDSYPALFSRVKSTLLALSDARLLEYKTSNPELYYKLGLEGIEDESAATLLLTIRSESDELLVELLIGDAQRVGAVELAPTYFVRKPDDARSMLIEANLDVPSVISNWIKSQIIDISSDRIQEIEIRHPDRTLRIFRTEPEQENYQLAGIPVGMRLKSQTTLDRMGTILEDFRIDDVRKSESYEFSETAVHTQIRTFDGLIVKAQAEYVENQGRATFSMETHEESEDRARVEAAALNERLADWVFFIPYFKYDTLARQIGPLVEEISASDDSESGG